MNSSAVENTTAKVAATAKEVVASTGSKERVATPAEASLVSLPTEDAVAVSVTGDYPLKEQDKSDEESKVDERTDNLDALREKLGSLTNTKLSFDISETDASGDIRFRVLDKESGEVVREFPPVSITTLVDKVEKLQGVGVVLDEAA